LRTEKNAISSSDLKNRIYEDVEDIVEKIECDICGDLLRKKIAERQPAVAGEIPIVYRVHPACKVDGKIDVQDKTGDN